MGVAKSFRIGANYPKFDALLKIAFDKLGALKNLEWKMKEWKSRIR